MPEQTNPITAFWITHYCTQDGLCSLCGNSGIIHTEGLRTFTGIEVGRANFCICPNGQDMRQMSKQENPENAEIPNLCPDIRLHAMYVTISSYEFCPRCGKRLKA